RSTIRLPDIRRPAPGAAVAAHAVPAPTAPRASRWAEAADTNSPIKEATDAGTSPAERLLGQDPWHHVSTRLLAFHTVLMRPKIWLACVAGLSLVILVTLVWREPSGSASIGTTQFADQLPRPKTPPPSTVPPARIVVPPAATEPELATTLDSHGSSPGLHPPSEVRVAERDDAARYDGIAGPESNPPDEVGATLHDIEPIGESGLATPEGASQTPEGASQTPEGASQTPEGASQPPEGASQPPEGASQPPEGASQP
ncbi:MAG TPA: hypothetical protein VMV69_13485, partial [Pirellulales bacterium]|nr:hypothetical protein [Pirellulales bacterium]